MFPTIFNIYVDDLLEVLTEEKIEDNIYAYADDIMILQKNKTQLIRNINRIRKWCEMNNIGLNDKKCGIMRIIKRKLSGF